MHSQYVSVCNDLPASKNLVNPKKNYTFLTKTFFLNK